MRWGGGECSGGVDELMVNLMAVVMMAITISARDVRQRATVGMGVGGGVDVKRKVIALTQGDTMERSCDESSHLW